jgi:hypothetical protein
MYMAARSVIFNAESNEAKTDSANEREIQITVRRGTAAVDACFLSDLTRADAQIGRGNDSS